MKKLTVKHPFLFRAGGATCMQVCFFGRPAELKHLRARLMAVSGNGHSPFRLQKSRLSLMWVGYVNQGGSLKINIAMTRYLGSGTPVEEASLLEKKLLAWIEE
jgi:hypothetical protein